jgi:hypothetical protein
MSSNESDSTITNTPEIEKPEMEGVGKNESIDKLTLELLMNKRQYRKYVEKHNPEEYTKKQTEYDRFLKYKSRISHLVDELLNDYSISGNSAHLGNLDIQDSFQTLLNSCIYFFETRDYDCPDKHRDDDKDDDILFSPERMNSTPTETAVFSAPFANHYRPGNSFWGKNVSKR